MSNKDLLNETIILARGEDWDGCFTAIGEFRFAVLEAELRKRLKDWIEE
jgi:hypothetical protein